MTKPQNSQPPKKPKSQWFLGSVPFFMAHRDGRYVEVTEEDAVVRAAADVRVIIHIGLVDGLLACTGVDLRSFVAEHDTEGRVRNVKPFEGHDGYQRVTSPLWRSIPIGGLIDRAVGEMRDAYRRMVAQLQPGGLLDQEDDPARLAGVYAGLAAVPAPPRRGPIPQLTTEQLQQMAHIHAEGGKQGVKAVRDALRKAGYPGSGPDGDVTRHQAASVVKQARRLGYISSPKSQVTS